MRPLLILLFLATTALAQQKQPPDLALTAADRARLIEAAASRIEQFYVEPAKAKEIAASLRAADQAGRFSSATSALQLVPPVNAVLRTSGDLHLRFGYSADVQPEDDAPLTPEQRAEDAREATRDGYGIHTACRASRETLVCSP